MATGFTILGVKNILDGKSARVTLSALPSGPVVFRCSRIPEEETSRIITTVIQIDPQTYEVGLPTSALWYIWAGDASGIVDLPGAAWIGHSDTPSLDNAGVKLQEILTRNLPGLNAALQTWYPGTTVKQIVYGSAIDVRSFPAIVITKPSMADDYQGIPFVRTQTFSFEIHFYVLHQDKGSWTQAAARFMGSVMTILNQPDYDYMELPDMILSMCHVSSGAVDEVEVEAGKFAAIGTAIWTGIGDLMDLPSAFSF